MIRQLILRSGRKIGMIMLARRRSRTTLRVILDAAKKRKEVSDHLLFSGPAGLGKTTLAYLVARELGGMIKTTSGPALEKSGDLAAVLTNLTPGEMLFIDEAHRINPMIEEVLYPAMEARKLHLMVGKGPSARTLSLGPSAVYAYCRDNAREFAFSAASIAVRRNTQAEFL